MRRAACGHHGPVQHVEIRVRGSLGDRVSSAFDPMQARTETVLSGPVSDQAELHGMLHRVRDLGLELVDVKVVAAGPL